MNPAISVDSLSKKYHIGRLRQQSDRLTEQLMHTLRSPLRRAGNLLRGQSTGAAELHEVLWALQDISFELQHGEVLGIMGNNGAGKSTLLKVLSGITEPTEGSVEIRGRVGSLLEVGTGFHPDLTGRENIYLNSAILGMKKKEIDRKFDEIVSFAEIERFLDTPVKHYSSGMYMRLGFSVAAHVKPEILIVDEVLAVGDMQFQQKCLAKMDNVAREGRTVIFVSHNIAAISALCSTALVLDEGRIVSRGSTSHCIAAYSAQSGPRQGLSWTRSSSLPASALEITQVDARLQGEQPHISLELEMALESRARHRPAFLAVDILDYTGTSLMQAQPRLDGFLQHQARQHAVKIGIELPPLIPGQYFASVWAGSHNADTLDEVKKAVTFEIHESPTPGRTYPHTIEHGYIVPPSTVSY